MKHSYKSFFIAFAAALISLLMLCGCSEVDLGKLLSEEIGSFNEVAEETTVQTETSSEALAVTTEYTAAETTAAETTEKTEKKTTTAETTKKTEKKTTAAKTEKAPQKYYFRNDKLFDSHYEKHGAEFGDITQDEYLALANELINAKGDNILHKTEKEDGDYLYYNTETNEFLVLSTDGYIRTFFKPDAGIDYWERQ
ncbi:MAG: hypothetical protein ACI4I2_07100 [Oscillospiraceae bacterium]